MTHLSADVLRRHLDEPDALLSSEKEHLLACPSCRALREGIVANASLAADALALDPPQLDLASARRGIEARLARGAASAGATAAATSADGASPAAAYAGGGIAVASPLTADANLASVTARRTAFTWTPRASWLTAAAAAVVLGFGLSLSPVRTTAANFLAIFEPHSFQPIAVSRADMQSLQSFPELSAFGDVQQTAPDNRAPQTFSNVLDVMRASHQIVLHPRYLPAGIPTEPSYTLTPARTGAFTFSAAKARQAALRNHATLPPMPANLDGSTLYASFAPAVVTTFGLSRFTGANGSVGWSTSGKVHLGARATGPRGYHRMGSGGPAGFSALAVFQAPVPRVYSTGASVRDIIDYLLVQPGVSPSLAAQIRAIGDPTTTLPIPIPVDKALAQTVSIGGSPALVVGDETGVGSIVVWERAGMVYGVAGPLRESELLAVANSLAQ